METEQVAATDIKPGDSIVTWYGVHRVVDIEPYVGTIDAAGIVRFANGTGMTFFTGTRWERVR